MLDEDDPLIGQVLENRYRVTARLGDGGMGLAYRARHVVFETDLALKVLRSAALRVRGALGRLQREAQVASAIGDPHIAAAPS